MCRTLWKKLKGCCRRLTTRSDPACAAKGIPSRLHTLGRQVDSGFDHRELLFRRVPMDRLTMKGAVTFKRMSVNRGKYSLDADDTLFDHENGGRHEGYAVVQFEVSVLVKLVIPHPQRIEDPYRIYPMHKPVQCMYPHSEVTAFSVPHEGPPAMLDDIRPPSVKQRLRDLLWDQVLVVLPTSLKGTRLDKDS